MNRLRQSSWAGGTAIALVAAIVAFRSAKDASPSRAERQPSDAPVVAKSTVELASLSSSDPAAVDMFAAVDRGELAIRLLPEHGQQARLELENRTNRPLTVELPPSFAGRASIMAGVGMALPAGPPQALGTGGMGSMPGGGGAIYCVPPEKVGYIRVPTACLEDEKPEPTPGMVYEVCRIEEVSAERGVDMLCARLSDAGIDRRAVQAAVWHVNCHRSWSYLAGRLKTCGGPHGSQPLFTREQLSAARRLTEVAMR